MKIVAKIIISLAIVNNVPLLYASAIGIPDGDTGLLISIAGNTTDQLVRLEKLLSNSEKQLEYTKQLKETTDALESSYDRLTNIQNCLNTLSVVGSKSPDELRALNDKIEEIQDQRDRLKDLIKESREAQAASTIISEEAKVNPIKVKEVVALDQTQIKRANSSSVKNQTQETAKNTAYINSKLTETNLLLRKNTETNAQTNALFAKNMAQTSRDQERSLEYIGVLKK